MEYKVTIELGKIGSLTSKQMIPFWFSGDAKFHMVSTINPKMLINDLRTISLENLAQIKYATTTGELVISDSKVLDKTILELAGQVGQVPEKKEPEIKAPVNAQTIDALKLKQLSDEAEKLLSQSVTKIVNQIGNASISSGILNPGIVDVDLLELAADYESKKQKRKSVVLAIKKRIKAIKEVGIDIQEEESLSITEEDVANIEINSEVGTISTIEKE